MTTECHICGAGTIEGKTAERLACVSSDAWPCSNDLHHACCTSCGTIQKAVDLHYIECCKAIYAGYSMGYLSGGHDPYVTTWDGRSGERCEFLADYVHRHGPHYPERVLDVGCGSGNYLAAYSTMPPPVLHGYDPHHKGPVGFLGKLLKGGLTSIQDKYDIVTCWHTLEHIVNPRQFLTDIKARMHTSALLFIAVPDLAQNPYDLVIYDHCTHFTAATLNRLLAWCGFCVVELDGSFIRKELIAVCKPIFHEADLLQRQLARCDETRTKAKEMAGGGLYGSANTAVWLTQEMGEVAYYVDDDPYKRGKTLLGKPVLAAPDPDNTKAFRP